MIVEKNTVSFCDSEIEFSKEVALEIQKTIDNIMVVLKLKGWHIGLSSREYTYFSKHIVDARLNQKMIMFSIICKDGKFVNFENVTGNDELDIDLNNILTNKKIRYSNFKYFSYDENCAFDMLKSIEKFVINL